MGVFRVIYLVLNEGYAAASGRELVRGDLCMEAIRLGRLLRTLMPETRELAGLLALMLLHDSRRRARVDSNGDLVLLEDQSRSLWDRERMDEGVRLVEEALGEGGGFYALQAAIAALHARAANANETDWPQIAVLYGLLLRSHPSAVVALNRAVAVAMAEGPERGLALIEALEAGAELTGYYVLYSAKADLLRRLGRNQEAAEAYRSALALVDQEPERRFLERRLCGVETAEV